MNCPVCGSETVFLRKKTTSKTCDIPGIIPGYECTGCGAFMIDSEIAEKIKKTIDTNSQKE